MSVAESIAGVRDAVRGASQVPFIQRPTCTIAEACTATGIGRTKLYELIGQGHVATTMIGRRRLVRVPSLLMLLGTESAATAS